MGGEIKTNFDFPMYISSENLYILEKNRIKSLEKKNQAGLEKKSLKFSNISFPFHGNS